MYIRVISQKTAKGTVRKYTQIVRSFRREDGVSTNQVIAHLGNLDPLVTENLKVAFQAAKKGQVVLPTVQKSKGKLIFISVKENMLYLPLAVISLFFRQFGLHTILDRLAPPPKTATSLAVGVEALVCQRCLEPDSKLAFQTWRLGTALPQVIGESVNRLNNTRVHRILDELAAIDEDLQGMVREQIIVHGTPRIIYLDLTDTWFEAGGGSLARRAQTKQGHRSKKKIHIALLVNEQGLPLKWQLLPGALNETTILPEWIDFINATPALKNSVLIFDRGMPSAANFQKLVAQEGHLFLTCIKSDAIPTYIKLDEQLLDQLQQLPDDVSFHDLSMACQQLTLTHYQEVTFLCDLGIVTPPQPKSSRQKRPPKMRMYLYFNHEIQLQKRASRQEKMDKITAFVEALNTELLTVRKTRKEEATRRKVTRLLEKLSMLELYEVILRPHTVRGRTKPIHSFQIEIKQKENMLRYARRYDGLSLVVGHPDLSLSSPEAIAAYRQKDVIEANFKIIKSVLHLRPTYHWTDVKIKSHVTLCTLALLIERLIGLKLKKARHDDMPVTADALFTMLGSVFLNRVDIGAKQYCTRTIENAYIRRSLEAIDAVHLLEQYEPFIKIDKESL